MGKPAIRLSGSGERSTPFSLGDRIDGATADTKLFRDLPLREMALPQHSPDFVDDWSRNHGQFLLVGRADGSINST
jgi:hypothetical protein